MRFNTFLGGALGFALAACPCVRACEICERTNDDNGDIVMTRLRPRMQPGAESAITPPRAQLEWGQLNVIHSTDTHGWLAGHLNIQNYGADWGDYASFVKHMRQTAVNGGVDLLVVDTGDLHDGTGLSDATSPDGADSNPIFENIDYDLLTIGNHELYVTAVAYETWEQFAAKYGDRYLTSNVQIYNPNKGEFEYISNKYKYFTTKMGLRIMSFGFLYDFTGNSNVSKVITAAETVNMTWFKNAVNFDKPIDLFLVLGHNPARSTVSGSTFGTIYNAIRSAQPDIPIQIFGGHTHIRDFAVYDTMTTGMESGRYCETLGWFSMNGFDYLDYNGPAGLPSATQPAVKVVSTVTASSAPLTASPTLTTVTTTSSQVTPTASAPVSYKYKYSRRYLDWNRLTFEYHANGSQVGYQSKTAANVSEDWYISPAKAKIFDTKKGITITDDITTTRTNLNLSYLLGCAPQSWCATCAPFGSQNNIYTLLSQALAQTVVQPARSTVPRLIILNTGSVRYDLAMGPFTVDDMYVVSPFDDLFQYIPNVPYNYATQVLAILNTPGHGSKKRDIDMRDLGLSTTGLGLGFDRDECTDPDLAVAGMQKRAVPGAKIVRRQSSALTAGYTTTDDFGTTGDDTIHTAIPYYSIPTYFQSNASLPANGSTPATVDLIFLDYFASIVVSVLKQVGYTNVSSSSVSYYMPTTFSTQSYLPAFAATNAAWQAQKPNCPLM